MSKPIPAGHIIRLTTGEGVNVAPMNDWNLYCLEWLNAVEHMSGAQCAIALDAIATRLEALSRVTRENGKRVTDLDLGAASDKAREAASELRCAIPQSLPK